MSENVDVTAAAVSAIFDSLELDDRKARADDFDDSDSEIPQLEHVNLDRHVVNARRNRDDPASKINNQQDGRSPRHQQRPRRSDDLTDDGILRCRHEMLSKIGELVCGQQRDEQEDSDDDDAEGESKKPFCGFRPGFFSKQNDSKTDDALIEVKPKKGCHKKQQAPIILDPETAKRVGNLRPFAVPPNQTPEQHLHAVALATGLTDKLLDEVRRDPELYSLLEDPKFGDVLLEFQFDPENAMKRHSSDSGVMDAMRKFSAILRKHFEDAA